MITKLYLQWYIYFISLFLKVVYILLRKVVLFRRIEELIEPGKTRCNHSTGFIAILSYNDVCWDINKQINKIVTRINNLTSLYKIYGTPSQRGIYRREVEGLNQCHAQITSNLRPECSFPNTQAGFSSRFCLPDRGHVWFARINLGKSLKR